MIHPFDISIIQLSLGIDARHLMDIFTNGCFGQIEAFAIGGNRVKGEISKANTSLLLEENWDLYYTSGNHLFTGVNTEKNLFSIGVNVENSQVISKQDLITFTHSVLNYLPFARGHIRNRLVNKQIYAELQKINSKDYDPLGHFFAADTSWVNVYPPQSVRGKHYLNMPDEFYLNIPAYKVEKLANGSIFVMLYPDPEANVNEATKATKQAIDYFKTRLLEFGIWGNVHWSPDWREKYRDFLRTKGFIV